MLKARLTFAAKLALTGLAFWYLAYTVDLRLVWAMLKTAAPHLLLLALALQYVNAVICIWRWQIVVRALGASLPFPVACNIFFVSFYFGQVLPGAIGGDAIRIWRAHKAGLSLRHAANSVGLERVLTVLGLLILTTLTQPLLMNKLGGASVPLTFAALTLAATAGIFGLVLLDRLPPALDRIGVLHLLAAVGGDSRRLFLKMENLAPALGVTILGHINMALIAWVLALAIGAKVTALDCIVLVPPAILVAMLPISIAGWGVREATMVTLFGLIGVPSVEAATISVLFGLVGMVSSLPGGVFWVLSRNRPQDELPPLPR